MRISILLAFLGNLSAFVLLILVTFSVPVIDDLYFLHSSVFGGTRFGVLGYCIESARLECTSLRIGYRFEPELYYPLPRVLVLFPVAAGFAGTSALLLLPSFFPQYGDQKPPILYDISASASFFSSTAAFAVAMWLFARAMRDFHDEGFTASFGPSIWMSLAAMVVTLFVALHALLGTCMSMRSRYARRKPTNLPGIY
ncbi:hypothetical protein L226DRAFT_535098 [Lentinus tigrinus ALCF2SS1-7]|uniref:Pali-domain-containing protein n=1 Tax=Lentinus tigrinus ALCF2SS1-6 TaxID=1328759 RepID=A0A5C2SA70_9APHY|nr:hypothetical protein L227DRAFT_575700 [Lentinus tigrinus ALCF2SS1-6]RPD74882.1 hypothetical protein L226DRAFT_535098 [Lentinus tigrinus ALCF2SS1-7]